MIRIIVIALLTTACSTARYQRTADTAHDAFIAETTIRYEGTRLNEWAKQNGPLASVTQLCQNRELDQAKKELKELLAKERNNASYWLVTGNCYWYERDLIKAEYFYKLGLSLTKKTDTKTKNALNNNIGVVYLERRLYPEASQWFELAADSLTARYNLAQVSLYYGDARSAKGYLSPLYQQNRLDPDVLVALALTHLIDNNSKLAIKVLSEIPNSERAREDVSFYLAIANFLQGNPDQSKQEIELMSKQNSSNNQLTNMAKNLEQLINQEIERREALQAKQKV